MCDTLVATGSVTASGHVIFAKNSDREPNEPQILLRIPRKKYDLSAKPTLKTTYINIDQVAETNEIVISKPAWMWGCEMGFNEHAVMIGNEAVFTKQPYGVKALTGMDMIRLALERNKTAKDAADYIILLLDKYGQGGNCGYTSKMQYHNSFIIADKNEAFVLETAGKFWVKKRVSDYYAISNGLTIDGDYEDCHPELRGRSNFSFRKRFAEPLHTTFSACRERRALAMDLLGKNKGAITTETMRDALGTHQKHRRSHFSQGSMRNLCMHAGGIISSQTTASLIGELKDDGEYWFTGSSLPCISIFKPFVFHSDFELFDENNQDKAVAFWKKRETVARMLLTGRLDETIYLNERNAVQQQINTLYRQSPMSSLTKGETGAVLRACAAVEEYFVDSLLTRGLSKGKGRIKGNLYFKQYWMKANNNLELNDSI